MKRSIITIIVIIFVAAVCYIAYSLYTQRPLPIEAGASTSSTSADTTTTDTQQNGTTTTAAHDVSIAIDKDFFLTSFSQTGFPVASATLGNTTLTATITVPTNPDGTIQSNPYVVVTLPVDASYPSDISVSLVAPDNSVRLQTSATVAQKNQPAITDADWTPVAN